MKVTGYPSIDKPHEKGYSHFAKNQPRLQKHKQTAQMTL